MNNTLLEIDSSVDEKLSTDKSPKDWGHQHYLSELPLHIIDGSILNSNNYKSTPYNSQYDKINNVNENYMEKDYNTPNPTSINEKFDIDIKNNFMNSFFKRKNGFEAIQKWEGVVTCFKKNDKSFTSRLKDLTNGGTDEELIFSVDKINKDDLNLLKEGAVFYFSIGYRISNSTKNKDYLFRFRRLPSWTEDEIIDAYKIGSEKLSKVLKIRSHND